jgi:hypothetical protein
MPHAALQLSPEPEPQDPTMERAIGEAVAHAAATIMWAFAERDRGEMSPVMREMSGDVIARLYAMRQFAYRSVDFDAIARREGKRILRERLPKKPVAPTEAQLDEWIGWPLEILARVIAHRLH